MAFMTIFSTAPLQTAETLAEKRRKKGNREWRMKRILDCTASDFLNITTNLYFPSDIENIEGNVEFKNVNIYGTTLSPFFTEEPKYGVHDLVIGYYTNVKINGGRIDKIYTLDSSTLEIKDAKIDTIVARGRKGASGSLVIEEGTTVNKIIYNMNSKEQKLKEIQAEQQKKVNSDLMALSCLQSVDPSLEEVSGYSHEVSLDNKTCSSVTTAQGYKKATFDPATYTCTITKHVRYCDKVRNNCECKKNKWGDWQDTTETINYTKSE